MDSAASSQTSTGVSGLVLSNVTIVDTRTGKLTPEATIVIEGGKIGKIARSADVVAGGDDRRIDGHGKFVVPGYWDMHAHPFNNPDLEANLSLMVAYGITGVRQMAGSPALLEKRKEGKLVPSTPGPELLAIPGDLLLPNNAGTPQAAVAEVRKQKIEGADFIKTIQISPEAFFASLEEAKRQGLSYEGHLSSGVSAAQASEAGMRSIEHLGAGEGMLVDCSADEAAVRQAIASHPPRPSPAEGSGAAAILNQKIALASPVLAASLSDPAYIKQVQHLIDTYSETKCRELAETFLSHDTWQVPTLIRLRTAAQANDSLYSENPDLRYAAPASLQLWQTVAKRYSAGLSADAQETLRRMFALQMKITRLFDQTGVKMLAGSDCGGSVWEVFGPSLHQEFDLLAQVGIAPLKVLQMTTLNGAEFYGRQASAGAVEEGKDANLVLLDENPVESVRNLHTINAVVRAGTYYSSDALNALKQKAAEQMASASNTSAAVN